VLGFERTEKRTAEKAKERREAKDKII